MKSNTVSAINDPVRGFVKDARFIFSVPTPKKYSELVLPEFPFDLQLLNLSPVYRKSRKLFLKLGGRYYPRICSTMRGLSAQDLFKNEIDYPPTLSELKWFIRHGSIYSDAAQEVSALLRFSEISIFHEQNHRIVWQILPPCPRSKPEVSRYLNFAEALVVTLDMVLGDELGSKTSCAFENLKMIYHPSGNDPFAKKRKTGYRNYLLAIFVTIYFSLETMHPDDVLKAVNYVLPGQKNLNRPAVKRAQELSELFRNVTNPEWQKLNWQKSKKKLTQLQSWSSEKPLILPRNSLDLEIEFNIAERVFDHFGI